MRLQSKLLRTGVVLKGGLKLGFIIIDSLGFSGFVKFSSGFEVLGLGVGVKGRML